MIDFLRIHARETPGASLRAVFIDQNCVYLGSTLIAESEAAIRDYDPRAVLDAAFVAGAAGFVLGKANVAESLDLEKNELAKARWLLWEGERVNLYLLDYLIVHRMDVGGRAYTLERR
ncbi:hypothetical protein GCM10007925_18680 [Sphingomonas astaxanthinifaciens DSM 22298]|uniref:Uncharacterized protein n=2 Tax=Sphingomonas TaxID=13687 RepID=A0ABQ5Z964_9SPHN|nr:hypothetical protein GCM10007925_18680 [Sphingomonas astaxanthinifaciens DSM 22298]